MGVKRQVGQDGLGCRSDGPGPRGSQGEVRTAGFTVLGSAQPHLCSRVPATGAASGEHREPGLGVRGQRLHPHKEGPPEMAEPALCHQEQ